jgi:hypothetical protein
LGIHWQKPEFVEIFLDTGITRGASDYYPFNAIGVPTIAFDALNMDKNTLTESGSWVIHSECDNLDYLNSTFPGRVLEALAEWSILLEHTVRYFEKR